MAASLESKQFHAVGKDGALSFPSEYLTQIPGILKDIYGFEVASCGLRLPFVLVRLEDDIAPEWNERPFLIAGLVALYIAKGKPDPPIHITHPGENSRMDAWLTGLSEEVIKDLKPYHFPKLNTLRAILAKFARIEAEAITYLNDTVIVELKKKNNEDFVAFLKELPRGFKHNPDVHLKYMNGPFAQTELSYRHITPKPESLVPGTFDDTDYVAKDKWFSSGAMISSTPSKDWKEGQIEGQSLLTNAGILVQKGNDVAMTVAFHGWENEEKAGKVVGRGDDFIVKQGHWEGGTRVGQVWNRLYNTDIGLAKLDPRIVFTNDLLGQVTGSAKSLQRADRQKTGDRYWIDTFVTGPQELVGTGYRVVHPSKENAQKAAPHPSGYKGSIDNLPVAGTCIEIIQGIYSTSAREIPTIPKIRDGVCGAPVMKAFLYPIEKKDFDPDDSTTSSNWDLTPSKTKTPVKDKVSTPSSRSKGKAKAQPRYHRL